MKPWSDEMFDGGDHDDEIEALYEKCKADEFYFARSNAYADPDVEEEYSIAITPAEIFDRDGEQWDQELQIEHLLPDDVDGCSEGIYDCERSWEEVRADLLRRGFRESEAFSEYSSHLGDG